VGCRHLSAQWSGDGSAAQSELPPGFLASRIANASEAFLVIDFLHCAGFELDGAFEGPANFARASILVDSADGNESSTLVDTYQRETFVDTTSTPRLARFLEANHFPIVDATLASDADSVSIRAPGLSYAMTPTSGAIPFAGTVSVRAHSVDSVGHGWYDEDPDVTSEPAQAAILDLHGGAMGRITAPATKAAATLTLASYEATWTFDGWAPV